MRIDAGYRQTDKPQRPQWNGWGRDLTIHAISRNRAKAEDVPVEGNVRRIPVRWLPDNRRSSAMAYVTTEVGQILLERRDRMHPLTMNAEARFAQR
jgi:hypothetical protein